MPKDYPRAVVVKQRFLNYKDGRGLPPQLRHAVDEMPIMWKDHDPARPWPKLEGKDKIFYDSRRRGIERQQREFVAVRLNLCRIAYLATGLIVPINMNLCDYSIHTNNGLITPPKQTITEFSVGAITWDGVVSFYTAFWRRIRFLKRHDSAKHPMWVKSRPVAVHAIRSWEVEEGYWFNIGQYNANDKYSTSPEWHEWYAKWGKEATLDETIRPASRR